MAKGKRGDKRRKPADISERTLSLDKKIQEIKQREEEIYRKYDFLKPGAAAPAKTPELKKPEIEKAPWFKRKPSITELQVKPLPKKPEMPELKPLPKLELPEIKPPELKTTPRKLKIPGAKSTSKLELPELKPPELPEMPELPELKLPESKPLKSESPELGTLEMPELPELELPELKFPELKLEELKTLKMSKLPSKIPGTKQAKEAPEPEQIKSKIKLKEEKPILKVRGLPLLERLQSKKIKKFLMLASLVIVFGVMVQVFMPYAYYLNIVLIPLVVLTLVLLTAYLLLIFIRRKQEEKKSAHKMVQEIVEETPVKDMLTFKTKLDDIYTMIKKEKEIGIKDIAERFDLTPEKAEDWAKTLKEQGLVEVIYPPIGQIEVRLLEKKKEPVFEQLKKPAWEEIRRISFETPNPNEYTMDKETAMATFRTTLDKFYNAIKSLEKVYLEDMAAKFDIPMPVAEGWALMLESKGMVKVRYPILGKTEIILKKVIK